MADDLRTPEEMRALAAAKQREAEAHHARAEDAGERLSRLLATGTGDVLPCPACGHVATGGEPDDQAKMLRLERHRFAGMGNAAGAEAMFWRAQADRTEAAMKEAARG